jgi:hypothetical protein
MDEIPTAVNLTTYSGGAEDFMLTPVDTRQGHCTSKSASCSI